MKSIFQILLVASLMLLSASYCFAQPRAKSGIGLLSRNEMFEASGGITYIGLIVSRSHQEIQGLSGTLGLLFSPVDSYEFETSYAPSYHLGVTSIYGMQNTDAYLLFEGEYSIPFFPEDDPFSRAHGIYKDFQDRSPHDTTVDSLTYAINFDYQKVHLRFGIGAFLKSWFNIQAGFDWAINTTPNRISYNSNNVNIDNPTIDLAIRDRLQDLLLGQNDFGAFFGAGVAIPVNRVNNSYFNWMLFLNCNYRIGLSDIIRTQSNDFRLQERQNRTETWQLSAGFRVSI